MSQNYDIDSLSRGFHDAAVELAKWSPHIDKDYVVNEIKVQTINVCTVLLIITVADSFFRGNIPFSIPYIALIGGAALLRQIAQRSLNESIFDKAKDKANKLLPDFLQFSKKNVPIPDMKGWGIFYLSPWLKEQLGLKSS